MASSGVVGGIIASVIGALASLLLERAWKRHKQKMTRKKEQP